MGNKAGGEEYTNDGTNGDEIGREKPVKQNEKEAVKTNVINVQLVVDNDPGDNDPGNVSVPTNNDGETAHVCGDQRIKPSIHHQGEYTISDIKVQDISDGVDGECKDLGEKVDTNKMIIHENDTKNPIENKVRKNPMQDIRRKTSNLFNVAPQNLEVTHYCKSLINISFHGQVTLKAQMELYHLMDEGSSYTLSALLQSLHKFLRSFGNTEGFIGDEEEFRYYIQGLMERRNQNDMDKFWKDAWKFIEIYKARKSLSDELNHTNYWGTRQQLLAGKVIADYIDKEYGPLDPVFGILLCPVAGRAGPGDSGIVHEILFDDDGPLAYHSAAHDAFGYLLTHHQVGPGYNYLGADCEVLNASRCMSGQISGLYFWKDVLKTEKSETRFSVA